MGNVTKTFKYQPAYAGLSMKNKFNSCCKDKVYFRSLQTFYKKFNNTSLQPFAKKPHQSPCVGGKRD